MRATTTCPTCMGRRIWRIDPVRERDLGVEIMPAWYTASGEPIGHFELYVCAGCGACEWWAVGLEAEARPGDPDLGEGEPACPACGTSRTWIVPMLDAVTGGPPLKMAVVAGGTEGRGRVVACICAGCGLARWIARGLESVLDAEELAPISRPCPCGSHLTYAAPSPDATLRGRPTAQGVRPPLRWERRSIAAHETFWGLEWRGKLELQLCVSCGRVEWKAQNVQQLAEDAAAGVTLLDGEVTRRGPYR